MATNNSMTGSYCLSKESHTYHITSSLLQYVLKMSAPARTQMRRPCATLQQHIQTVWLTATHSLLMRRFSSSMSEILVR